MKVSAVTNQNQAIARVSTPHFCSDNASGVKSEDNKMSKNTKIMLGATAVAAVVIGGLLVAKAVKTGKTPDVKPKKPYTKPVVEVIE